ncbi:50S ribosomal protein L10 [uncultured archaeon]|nr:50S ribosomal protein L10 [uncultured archaeon]
MVADWKTKELKHLVSKIKAAKVVGVVNIEGVPSKQFQSMRRTLGKDVEIRVARKNIISRALHDAKVGSLGDHVSGSSGLILTNLDPFKLEKRLKQCEVAAPAKAGSLAPFDIVIPKGDTPFPAGPIIGELQTVGIKAKIEAGKIVVKEDSPVVKQGEPISPQLATVLARLGIEPVTIALKLNAAYDGQLVYTSDVLHVDAETTIAKLADASRNAFNLAVNAGIVNSKTIEYFITEASKNARNLAINAEIVNKQTVDVFISQANAHAKALFASLPPEVWEKKTDEKAAE